MKGLQLWSGTQHTLFCREISFVASYTRDEGGGSQKVTNDDEGEGGVTIPPKNDDVIYEQSLRFAAAWAELSSTVPPATIVEKLVDRTKKNCCCRQGFCLLCQIV